jgi:hypothetical protein
MFSHLGILDKIPGLAAGTVAANDGRTLTVTMSSNTKVTVTTTAKTVVVEQVTASFDKIRVGDLVVATAAPSAGGPAPSTPPTNLTATHVEIVPAALASLGGDLGGPLGMFGGWEGHAETPGAAPELGNKDSGTEPSEPSAPSGAPAPSATASM